MAKQPKRPRRSRKQGSKRTRSKIVSWELVSRGKHADQFALDPRIVPKGSSYQWCSWDLMGEPDDMSRQAWRDGGWKPVPSRRHPGAPKNAAGHIYFGGQLLMERDAAITQRARDADYEAAVAALGKGKTSKEQFQQISELKQSGRSPICSEGFWPDRPIEPTVVEISIKVCLSASEVEVASFCHLTNEKYASNKLALLAQRRFDPAACAALMPTSDGAAFTFAGLSLAVKV